MDSSTPQRVTQDEGRLLISGLSARFMQDTGRRLTVEATALAFSTGYALSDGAFVPDLRVTGRAWLPQDVGPRQEPVDATSTM